MNKTKKRFIGVITAMFLLTFAAACVFGACGKKSEEEPEVKGVTLSPTSTTMEVEDTLDLTASVSMSSGSYSGSYVWTSSNTESVNFSSTASGSSVQIKAYNAGSSVITVSVDGGFTATCNVTVNETTKEELATVESVTLNPSSLNLTLNENGTATGSVTATVKMSDNSNFADELSISSLSGVTFLQTNKGNGTVTISVTATSAMTATSVTISAGGKSATLTLTVNAYTEPAPADDYAVSVTAADGTTEVEVEGSLQLTATVTNNGTEVSGATVEWTQSSTDGGAVEFDSTTSGLITGKTAGTVTITATYTPNGGTAVSGSITINVKAETKEPQPETPTVTGITLSGDALDGYNAVTLTLADGTATATITAKVTMSDGSDYSGDTAPQATCDESNLTVTVGEQNADGTYTITITASGEVTSAQVKVSLGSVETTFTVTVNTEPAAPHEHTFVDAQPVVDWTSFDAASDKTAVQVTYTCTDNECDQSEGYTVTITATVTSVGTAATCTENAYTTYTATWASDDGLLAGTDTHVVTYENTAGHVYSDGSEVTWTWTLDTQNGGYMVTAVVKCDNCDETVNATVTVTYDENNIRYTATATIEGRDALSFTDVLQEEMTLAGENVTLGGVEYKANPGLSVTVSENSEGEKVYSVSGAAYGLEEAQLVNFPGAALGDAYVAVRFYVGYGETLNYGWDGKEFTKTTGANPNTDDPWGTIIIHVTNGGAVKFQLVKADGTSEIFWISFENLTYSDITMEASSSSVSVEVGKTKTLSVTVKKNGVDITDSVTLDWSFTSDVENLITLEGGVITAGNGEGTATVTVTYKYGEGDEDCVCVAIIVNVVSGDQREAEERLTAVKESIDFNGATFTNQSDVSFVYDYKSETPDETYGYYYIYMRAEGTASSMNAAQVEAFDPDVSLHTPYVVLTITLNPGETVSYKSGRSVTNDTDEVEYDVIVVSITNYAYYQFKITSEDDSVGTMYVVDFSYMNKAAGHAFPETSEGLTWNWEGRDTTEKTVDVSFVCDDHVVSVTAQYTIDANGVMTATAVFDEEHSYEGTWNLSSVGTAEGLVNAFAESETEVNITLTADIKDAEGSTAVFDAFYYTFYYSTDTRTVTVDLNAHTIDLSSDIYTFIIIGNDVTFRNGELVLPDVSKWAEYGCSYSTMGMLEVQSGSLTLDGITIKNACGTVVFVDGEGTKATIKNSTIETTGAYGVGTNASDPYDCEIVIESSYIIANAEACDGTGVFMNVPGKLTIVNSTIEGDIQAVVARGGEVSITGSTLKLSGNYVAGTGTAENLYTEDYGDEVVWGGGNNLPYAALVLGNNYSGNSYQYPTTATLNGVTFDISSASDAWAIYAYSYNSTCTVSVTLESGWTYASGLDYLGITYLDDEATLPVYCGISGEGSITVGGIPLDVKPYITGVSLDVSENTLDLNGKLEFVLSASVTMSDGSTYEGEYAWTYEMTEGEGVITTSGYGAALTIMAASVGIATVTVTVGDYTASCVVTVVDTTPEESDVQASISVDFSDENSYSWITKDVNGNSVISEGEIANGSTNTSSNGLLTFMATASGTSAKMSITEAVEATDEKEGSDGYLTTAGGTASGSRYFQINLSEYTGSYVSVTVKMSDTGNNGNRSIILASAQNTSNVANGIAYATSDSSSDVQTFNYVMYVTGDPLYITWSGSIRIYSIDIVVSDNLTPTPTITSASLTAGTETLTLVSGETVTTNLTLTVTIDGQETSYGGGFTASSSDEKVATVSVDENGTITVTAIGIGAAEISLSLWNAPSVEAACRITVEANYVGSITLCPDSLTLEKGTTGEFTFTVSVTTKTGDSYTGNYDISVESKDTAVAVDSWDTSCNAVTVTANGSGKTTIVITLTVDGIVLATVECAVEVTDANQTSIHIDFSDSTTYSSMFGSETTLTSGQEYTDWILTFVAGSSSSIDASKGYLVTGGNTTSSNSKGTRVFIIDLQSYVEKYVSISVTFASHSSGERSTYVDTAGTSNPSSSSSEKLKSATSTGTSDKVDLNYVGQITETCPALYLTFDNSIDVYTIDIEILDSADPEVQGVSLSKESLTIQVGGTAELTATVKMNFGDYEGTYEWVSDNTLVTVVGTGATVNIVVSGSAVGSETATITVTVGEYSATCAVTVVAGAVAAESIVVIFSGDNTSLATDYGFTVSGNYKSSVTFEYDGTSYSKPLKMEGSTAVTFTTNQTYTLTMYVIADGGGALDAGKKIKVDGSEYTNNADGFVTLTIEAGEHTISKGDTMNLCYLILTTVTD